MSPAGLISRIASRVARQEERQAILRKVRGFHRNAKANSCGTAVDYLGLLAKWLRKRDKADV